MVQQTVVDHHREVVQKTEELELGIKVEGKDSILLDQLALIIR